MALEFEFLKVSRLKRAFARARIAMHLCLPLIGLLFCASPDVARAQTSNSATVPNAPTIQVAQFAPSVIALTPATGTTLGGTAVTITGTDFTGATSVTIGGTAATGFTVVSPSTITATTPAGTAGAASVLVTTPSGTNTANTLFQYNAPVVQAPTVTAISPASGVGAGGTAVTITGTGFTGVMALMIGGGGASNMVVVNDTTITAVTPMGESGAASVSVTTPNGTSAPNTLFTYLGPKITSISPTSGPSAGGTVVTITGSGFTGATYASFDYDDATNVVVISDTQMIATTPESEAGVMDVQVITPSGSGIGHGLFTYIAPPPTVTAIEPNTGSTLGGTAVTITGTSFIGASAVTIGGKAVSNLSVDSDTLIIANAPPGTPGTASVVVTTPAGSNPANTLFTFVAPPAAPTVSAITPATGTTLGGTAITLTGTGFLSGAGVSLGGTAATNVVVVSATSITATAPAHAEGAVDAIVTTTAGSSAVSAADKFTYAVPTATHFSVSAPASASAGSPVSVVVSALDATNTVVTAYSGTVHFTGTDAVATLPANATLVNGVGTFSATLKTAGSQTITATDTVTAGITGVSAAIIVSPGAGSSLAFVQQPANVLSGAAITPAPSVQVLDAFGNVATGMTSVTLAIGSNPSGGTLSGTATVAASSGMATFAGISIDKAGSGYTLVASSAALTGATSASFNVTAGANVISFAKPADTAFTATPPTLGATASSGLAVSYASTTAAVCTVTPAGALTFKSAGICTVTADQSGNTNYAAATQVTQSFNVTAGANVISFTSSSPTSVVVGSSAYTPTATSSSGLAVSIALDASSSGCSLSSGVVSFDAVGTCLIDASQTGNANYAAATPLQQSISIGKAATSISLSVSQPSNVLGSPVTISANVSIVAGTPASALKGAALRASAAASSTPTGTVQFSDGGMVLGTAPLTNGVATLTLSTLSAGSHNISASYSGSASSGSASTTVAVSVIVVLPKPVATSFSINVPYLGVAAIDLSTKATGTITSYAIKVPPLHGSTSLSGSLLTYSAANGYSGPDSITFTAIGPGGASVPGIIAITVGARPDPTQDPSVAGTVQSQVTSARRMAETQMGNVSRRLDALHEDDQEPFTMGLSFASPDRPLSPAEQAIQNLRRQMDPQTQGTAPKSFIDQPLIDRHASAFEKPAQPSSSRGASSYSVWTAGVVTFGSQTFAAPTGAAAQSANKFTTSGVTAGVDTKVIDGLKVGMAVGFAGDSTIIGTDRSSLQSRFASATLYASWRAMPQTFVDVAAGYGRGTFASNRFSTGAGLFLNGQRAANEFFGSLSLTSERKWGALKFAPYVRLDALSMQFSRYSEAGSDIWGLSYAAMNVRSISGVLGLRASYALVQDWGTITPMVNAEYRHAFAGGINQQLGYTDLGSAGTVYTLPGQAQVTNLLSGSIGIRAETNSLMSFELEYQNSASLGAKLNSGSIRASVMQRF